MRNVLAALTCVLVAGGCATNSSTGGGPLAEAPPVPPDRDCDVIKRAALDIAVSPMVARAGTDLTVAVQFANGPDGWKPVPAECLSEWSVSEPAWASLSAAHDRVAISPDAPSGEILTIGVSVKDQRVERPVTIVGAGEVVLTGYWNQKSVTCAQPWNPPKTVRELQFTDSGAFNVTYTPFERFVDFWGQADIDLERGTIVFEVTGGNNEPGWETATAGARVDEDGLLHLDGIVLEPAFQNQSCDYVFGKG